MSLILDALNRADRERAEENHIPNLHASHGPALQTSSPIRRWIIEGVIIATAIAVFAYSQWPDETVTPVAPITSITSIKPTTPVPAQPGPVKPRPAEPEPVVEKSVVTKATEKPETDTAINALYKKPVKEAPVVKKSIVSTPPVTEPVVEQEVDNTLFILQQIPLITERSTRFQRGIPTINYEVHVYSAEDGAGFVKLNGSIARVGTPVAPGLRLIAILNDSIVLDMNGTQFRLPALNSWVNYN